MMAQRRELMTLGTPAQTAVLNAHAHFARRFTEEPCMTVDDLAATRCLRVDLTASQRSLGSADVFDGRLS